MGLDAARKDLQLEIALGVDGHDPGDLRVGIVVANDRVPTFLVDMRRRASAGLVRPAAVVATGIVAGLYMVDPPEDGSVLAYAGPDVPGELADAVLDEAGRLGLDIDPQAAGRYWPRWDELG